MKVGGVLDVPGQRESAFRYRHVVPARDRPEVVELDLIEPEGRFDGRVGLSEEIRVAVEPEPPASNTRPSTWMSEG